METYSNNNKIILGRGCGINILNSVKKAKNSVKIVSPYLSPDYIKELINLHKRGIKITLITCDNIETNLWSDFKVSDIIKSEKIRNKKLIGLKKSLNIIGSIIFMISLIMCLFYLLLDILIILYIGIAFVFLTILILGISFIIKEYDFIYTPIFPLKVFDSKSGINPHSTNLIHSKIYLIDNKVLYLGSANYTYSAFNTHYETIVEVKDYNAIKDINDEIINIFNSKDFLEKPYKSL